MDQVRTALTLSRVSVGFEPATVERDSNGTVLLGLELFPIELDGIPMSDQHAMGHSRSRYRLNKEGHGRGQLRTCKARWKSFPQGTWTDRSCVRVRKHLFRNPTQKYTKVR